MTTINIGLELFSVSLLRGLVDLELLEDAELQA